MVDDDDLVSGDYIFGGERGRFECLVLHADPVHLVLLVNGQVHVSRTYMSPYGPRNKVSYWKSFGWSIIR